MTTPTSSSPDTQDPRQDALHDTVDATSAAPASSAATASTPETSADQAETTALASDSTNTDAPATPHRTGRRTTRSVEEKAKSEKSRDFWGSGRRFVRMMAPDKWLLLASLVMTIVSVGLTVWAPRILGDATNIIYQGVLSNIIADYPNQDAAVAALETDGNSTLATMLRSVTITPGAGIDFGSLSRILMIAAFVYAGASIFRHRCVSWD